jgi:three-Cys-motif partner protein
MAAQRFGGPWTVLKVETVAAYLHEFCTALQNKPARSRPFRRLYIDGFAGSGAFEFGEDDPSTFFPATQKVHAGSPIRALEIVPRFDELHFIEMEPNCVAELKEAVGADPRVAIHDGDANLVIAQICRSQNWSGTRGVIFLDPYDSAVDFGTLKPIADTGALDVWYLFPTMAVFRNAPISHTAMTSDKRATITRILGTDEWETEFYPEIKNPKQGLFGNLPPERRADVHAIERFVKQRLETVFPSVIGPRTLRTQRNAPLFSLFFCVSNPSKAAQAVANRIAGHLLKKK